MQLLVIVLAAFGLGFWFARSEGPQRLSDFTRHTVDRFGRKSEAEPAETTAEQS